MAAVLAAIEAYLQHERAAAVPPSSRWVHQGRLDASRRAPFTLGRSGGWR